MLSPPVQQVDGVIVHICCIFPLCIFQVGSSRWTQLELCTIRRYDMSTSLPLTKWPPNFRTYLICCFFTTNDVLGSKTILKLFIHTPNSLRVFRISIFYFGNGKVVAPTNHMKSANIPFPVGFMKATVIYLAWKDRQR